MDWIKRTLKKISNQPADLKIVIVFFFLGIIVGRNYYFAFTRAGFQAQFAQFEFSPAVALYCGYGYNHINYWDLPALKDFMQVKTDTFSCSDLPENPSLNSLNISQRLYPYLISSVSLVWFLSGNMSWDGLAFYFGVLYGLSIILSYGIFRLGMGRFLAVLGTLALTVSSVHLVNLPHLRDYAKAPFILAMVLIMGLLVTRPFNKRTLFGLSIAYGLIMGIGLGFRNDVMINILPFVITLFFFMPGGSLTHIKQKLVAITLFVATFVAVAWPVISTYASGSNTGHVILLGFMSSFDPYLGITGSFYEWGYLYSDGFVASIARSYAERIHHQPDIGYLTSEYDQAMFQYIFEIAKNFPADVLARSYGAILQILELPFTLYNYSPEPPHGITHPSLVNFYLWRVNFLQSLQGSGIYLTVLTLLLVGVRSFRKFLFILFFVGYFAGLPAIQFHSRHFFYLEFITWFAMGFVLQQILLLLNKIFSVSWVKKEGKSGSSLTLKIIRPNLSGLQKLGSISWQPASSHQPGQLVMQINLPKEFLTQPRRYWPVEVQRLTRIALLLFLIIFVPLWLLRAYQQNHLDSFLQAYLDSEKSPLTVKEVLVDNGQVLFEITNREVSIDLKSGVQTEYLVAEFTSDSCQTSYFPVTFKYDTIDINNDFSMTVHTYVLPGQTSQIYFPIYNTYYTTFRGVELPEDEAELFKSVYSIKDLSRFPLLLNLNLPPDWKIYKPYQVLTNWEDSQWGQDDNNANDSSAKVYTSPTDLSLPSNFFNRYLIAPGNNIAYKSKTLNFAAQDRLITNGQADSPNAPLLQMQPKELDSGTYFVAEGILCSGGFTLGLLKNDQWAEKVDVTDRGPFRVVLKTPADDIYSLVMNNNLQNVSLQNSFIINKSGWIK